MPKSLRKTKPALSTEDRGDTKGQTACLTLDMIDTRDLYPKNLSYSLWLLLVTLCHTRRFNA